VNSRAFSAEKAVNKGIISAKDAENMPFIHEISEWPHLKWDDAKLSPMLADERKP